MMLPPTQLRPFRADDSPRAVLNALRDDAVAILVDGERKPIGVLTLSDTGRLQQAVPQARKAADLFELGREIFTVRTDAEPAEVARLVLQHGLKTGITAVDTNGCFAGYIFVRDLRGVLPEVKVAIRASDRNLEDLKREHPAPYDRVERLFRSGSKD